MCQQNSERVGLNGNANANHKEVDTDKGAYQPEELAIKALHSLTGCARSPVCALAHQCSSFASLVNASPIIETKNLCNLVSTR